MNKIFLMPLFLMACQNTSTLKVYNSSPTIEILSHSDGATLLEGEPVEFFAQASDLNHDASELSVGWFSADDTLCDWSPPADDGGSICNIAPTIDMESIRVEVRDPDQSGGMTEVGIEVIPTGAPIVEVLSPLDSERYYTNIPVQFAANVSDAEDSPEALIVTWSSDIDGALELNMAPDSSGYVSDFTSLSEGEHVISVLVEDTMNKSTSVDTLVLVSSENNSPACSILEPLTGEASQEGNNVLFHGEATDADIPDSELSVIWQSDKDGILTETNPTSAGESTFSTATLSLNTHVITLTVIDDTGAECSDDIVYTIGSPPSFQLLSPNNGDVYDEGVSVTFAAQVSDLEDQIHELNVTWESSLDGTINALPPDSTGLVQFVNNTLNFGTHTITATVTDSDGLYARNIFDITINGVPTAPSVSLMPDPVYTTDNLTAVASGSIDPDGTLVSYTYEWYQNGVLTGSTGTLLSSSNTTKGDNWTVRVTPTDGITTGPYVEESITISNSPPEIGSMSISPNNPSTQDTISCSATGTDADGDPTTISYSWLINSSPVSGTSSSLSGPFVNGDVITCRATPNDGSTDGSYSQLDIIITNTPPVVTSVALSPLAIYTNDLLTATVTASDPDGDPLSYTWNWYVDDGSGFQLAYSNSSSTQVDQLDGTLYFERDDAVYVEVIVSDSSTVTTLSSAQLSILNSPPTAFNALITPLSPVAGLDDLVCTAQDSDSDLDLVTLTYSWTVDGASTNYATNTIPASDIADGEVWECSIIPFDQTDYGPTATVLVTVGADVLDAVGSSFCSSAGTSTDSSGYELVSCLSAQEIGSGEISDSSGYQLQVGSHFVYTPE